MWQSVLKEYQKDRIQGFFFPGRDPLGINYSVIQSKIAIGSAGLLGKGFGQGTQVQLGFLPEHSTDFIFATLVEEWGWLTGFILILVFGSLILRIIKQSDHYFIKNDLAFEIVDRIITLREIIPVQTHFNGTFQNISLT